jgi:hypothetical protein
VSRFGLKTRQGYALSVIGLGNVVVVEVTRERRSTPTHNKPSRRGRAVTAYVARGVVTANRIEASFGEFGKISVRFHPSGQVSETKPRRHCEGTDRFTSDLGVFVGSVRFTGENHYVSVRAHRAKGTIRSPLHPRCLSRHFLPPVRRDSRPVREVPSSAPTFLGASWRQAVTSTEFLTIRLGKKTLFLAVTEQSKGSTAEVRYAVAIASSNAFVTDDSMTTAAVTPPAPFDGKGSYSAGPDGTKTWSGSLRASFPGASRLPLTGPQFEVALASGF